MIGVSVEPQSLPQEGAPEAGQMRHWLSQSRRGQRLSRRETRPADADRAFAGTECAGLRVRGDGVWSLPSSFPHVGGDRSGAGQGCAEGVSATGSPRPGFLASTPVPGGLCRGRGRRAGSAAPASWRTSSPLTWVAAVAWPLVPPQARLGTTRLTKPSPPARPDSQDGFLFCPRRATEPQRRG